MAEHKSQWIKKRDKTKPSFMYLPFLAPHERLEAPKELVEKYQNIKDGRPSSRSPSDDFTKLSELSGVSSRRSVYAAVVDAMDQAVGRVLAALEQQGIADNTIVMFFSDNGATRLYGRGGGDNSPFRGGKAEVYEGGIRVVSLLCWRKKNSRRPRVQRHRDSDGCVANTGGGSRY